MNWWDELRSEFPLCERLAYFFSGAQAPLAHPVRRATEQIMKQWSATGWRMEFTQFDHFERCQVALGSIMNCSPDRVVTCEGTGHALNIAAAMVLNRSRRENEDEQKNVVFHSEAYAAGSYPWLNAIRLGAKLEARWPVPQPGTSHLDAMASAIDDHTLAVVTTHVSPRTGERLNVVELADSFSDRQWALIVDAAQSAGAVTLMEEVAATDFIAMPAYKWLFGPPGVGFLIIGERWIDDPGPPFAGWASAVPGTQRDPKCMKLAVRAQGFRVGQPNHVGVASAAAALELANRYSPEGIARRIESLTGGFLQTVAELGISTPTPLEWPDRAGVVCLDVADADRLMEDLHTQSIETGVVGERLRVDIHAFNNITDIDRIGAVLSGRAARHRQSAADR